MTETCIVFEIWGDYANFRKPYSTTSSISYFFPPKPTIIGMLAAILGYEKNSYAKLIEKMKVSLILENKESIHKEVLAINYENTSESKFSNTPTNIEIIFNPRYRIYVLVNEDKYIFDSLEENLKKHNSAYTISLGSAFCIANFKFIGIKKAERLEGKDVVINSVIPRRGIATKINVSSENHIIIEKMPYVLDHIRKPLKFMDFFADIKGKGIRLKEAEYWKVEKENVIFF